MSPENELPRPDTPGEPQELAEPAAPADQRVSPQDAAKSSTTAQRPADAWEAQLAEANDRLLRTQAELENFRKRAFREQQSERLYAALPLLRDLLSVVDNFQLAMEAAEQHENGAGLLEGVKMVAAQLDSVLEKHHCKPIEAAGQPFDPHYHEAVAQEPSGERPAGHVARVTRTGYQLHDRVIRPSQVFVSSGPAASADAGSPTEDR